MRAIAMKCTRENWEDIKPILDKHNYISDVPFTTWVVGKYLTNNFNGYFIQVCNTSTSSSKEFNRTVYEEWDKNIFLEACDIKIKFTIQDLAEGKCALVNDGTVDELHKVLKVAFPKTTSPRGTYKYYRAACTIGNIYNGNYAISDRTELPAQSVKDFIIENTFLKQETNMSKFPFYLNPSDAQKIIDIACSTWKNKLAGIWASYIVLSKQIEISQEFYKDMRKACTSEQNLLFDDIFGKDTPEYKYKDGELVFVRNFILNSWELRYTDGVVNGPNLRCYDSQQKTGATRYWAHHQPAPGVVLPD